MRYKVINPKIKRIIIGVFLIIILVIGITAFNHPIILKWLVGSARIIGRSTNAIVYTNGVVNNDVKVFHVKKSWDGTLTDYFLLYFPDAIDSRLQYLCVHKKAKYAGGASSTNIRDYDMIGGLLFQSEVGGQFTPMQHPEKGFNFDPELVFNENQFTLNIPPKKNRLKFDSLRVLY